MHKSLSLALLIAGCGSTSPDDNSAPPLYDTAVPDATPLPNASIDATVTPLPYKGIVYATVEGRDSGQKYFVTYDLQSQQLQEIASKNGIVLSVPKGNLASGFPTLSPNNRSIVFGSKQGEDWYLSSFNLQTGEVTFPVPLGESFFTWDKEENIYYPIRTRNNEGFLETAIYRFNLGSDSTPVRHTGQVGLHDVGLAYHDGKIFFTCIDPHLLPRTPEQASDFEHPYHKAPRELCFTFVAQRDGAYAKFTNFVSSDVVINAPYITAGPNYGNPMYFSCDLGEKGKGLCQINPFDGTSEPAMIPSDPSFQNPIPIVFNHREEFGIFRDGHLWDAMQTEIPAQPVIFRLNLNGSILNDEPITGFTPFAFRDTF